VWTVQGGQTGSRCRATALADDGGDTAARIIGFDGDARPSNVAIGENAGWNTVGARLAGGGLPARKRGGTTRHAAAASARYVRLNVIAATETTDSAARFYEVEVYAWRCREVPCHR
jgi:hypothetical protein